MSNSFFHIYKLIHKHPKIALLIAFLFLIASAFVIKQIKFNEDINKVIPIDDSTATASSIVQQMSFTDKIAVIFSKNDKANEDDLREAAQSFLDTVVHLQPYYHDIQGVLDEDLFNRSFQFIFQHLPIYLNDADYQVIEKKIERDSIEQQVSRNYEALMGTGGAFMKDVIVHDPLQLSFLALNKLHQFQGGTNYVFDEGFLFSKDKTKLFLFINPKFGGAETKNNEVFVEKLREIQSKLNTQYAQVETSYFGSAFIAVANAKQIKQDILTTVAISVTLLMLMLIFYYRNWLVPIIVMIPSVFGGLLGIICLYFVRSEISAISLSISAILIGITIDYALHFLTHAKGNANQKELFKDVSKPLLMSSSTTAIAFLCLLFVRSEALIDLGIFASIAVVATAIFTLIILPHVYKGKEIKHAHTIDRIAGYPFEKNKILISISLLLLIVSLFTYHRVGFDGDLSKINYIPKDQALAEKALNQGQEVLKSLFIVNYGKNEEEVLQNNEDLLANLKQQDAIISVQSISSLIPSHKKQIAAIERWQQFWANGRSQSTIAVIEEASVAKGFLPKTHQAFYDGLTSDYSTVSLDSIKTFNEQFYREFVHGKKEQLLLSTLVSIRPKDRDQFVSHFEKTIANKPMLLIDRQALNEQYLGYLIKDFNSLVSYSFIAVFLILFIFYKRIELVIVASIPIALTGFITAGLMGVLQVPFNIFSTIVCTLIFGHGIDFTIFMTSALQKQYTNGKDEMAIYRTSIILAVLTTILAIGALIFAKHPALKSISSVALIGVSVAVLVTFVLYPILFKFLFFNRIKKGLSPINLRLLVQSILLFAYFAIASIFVSILIRGLFWILPMSKLNKQLLFSKWMSWYMRSVLFLKFQKSNRTFRGERISNDKPSIIIANHSSFLDSLSIGRLYSRIVFLVNDWVYRSPVFGRAVRFLGFLSTSAGIEGQMDQLKNRIGETFSIAIFPEGTRSRTSEIHRFHKGAFYLSEELQMPITPVYLHGNAEALPKGDFIIYDGIFDIHVGEPIDPSDLSFGENYAQRSKNIALYFRESFKAIRLQNEDENYFKQKLFLNYRYKDAYILSQVKKDFRKHNSIYYKLFKEFGEKEKIAHITSDYGQLDFLLVHQFAGRKIRSFNINTEHRAIAKASFIVNKFDIQYVETIDQVWQSQKVLLLSALTEFQENIPDQIERIVMVCCTYQAKFPGFKLQHEESNYQIYERYEGN
ncbi:MMPL family transporter [Sphingobacterium sp. DK4209]|uniref:MMPL family transporter n=1 Tax=Sphingobacterium zhuxiongii TaxID=2662364 RepID=A0A5Q0Q9T0_9SPHI|nr:MULTISPECIES: 1-acyl-sn-glycerol-3-phosphate acyltransferase [unclassified Sphingobacterium]MVZ64582.1 MMPL family transporter [Sphingobacterium sp. DK4209]QGA25909.1 MMPL family transporter [Sphingobacterium sp. dk4302]